MSDFQPAYDFTRNWEGQRYTDDPDDKGGPTHYGITLGFLKGLQAAGHGPDADLNHDGLVDAADVKDMTAEEAADLYQRYIWDAYPFKDLEAQPIATKCFDMVVNMRPKQAVILMQRACNSMGSRLTEDGVMGPATVAALNSYAPRDMLNMLRIFHKSFYAHIIRVNPSQQKWQPGWFARAEG